jgi:hypothetical protein
MHLSVVDSPSPLQIRGWLFRRLDYRDLLTAVCQTSAGCRLSRAAPWINESRRKRCGKCTTAAGIKRGTLREGKP